MGKPESFTYILEKFPEGIVTARARDQLGAVALADGSEGCLPYYKGNLSAFPRIQTILRDTNYSAYGPTEFVGANPEKVVGLTAWSPVEGLNLLVVAVYGQWPGFSDVWEYCTIIMLYRYIDDELIPFTAKPGEIPEYYPMRGYAPIKFATMAVTNDGFPEYRDIDTATYARSNWLIVATPHDYVSVIEIEDTERGYIGTRLRLPYVAASAAVWRRHLFLTGVPGYQFRVLYTTNPDDLGTIGSMEIGETSGEPNIDLIPASDELYVTKPSSLWVISGNSPEDWLKAKVLSRRGGIVYFPSSGTFGIIQCDEQGIYAASGQPEDVKPLSAKIPQMKAEHLDLIQMFEQSKWDTEDQFDRGSYDGTCIENWGTEDIPIHIMTLDRYTSREFDRQNTTNTQYDISEAASAYQTFRVGTPTEEPEAYWATMLRLYLAKVTDDCEVGIELIEYTGSDPTDEDTHTLLWIGTADVTRTGVSDYIEVSLIEGTNRPIYINSETETNYLIRVTALTNNLRWNYNNAGGYADGECSWDSGDDAGFSITGFQYVDSYPSDYKTWTSNYIDVPDIKCWGVALYREAEQWPDWELRVKLQYQYAHRNDLGLIDILSPWYEFSDIGWGSWYYPSGGVLRHSSSVFNVVRIRVGLRKIDEIPPFIDWAMLTYSQQTTEIKYPGGYESQGNIFLSGIMPDKDDLVFVNTEGAIYKVGNRKLSHLTEWEGMLLAGTLDNGRVVRIHREGDASCWYGDTGSIKVNSGFIHGEDPRKKKLKKVEVVWKERSNLLGVTPKYYLVTIEGERYCLDYLSSEIETETLAGDDNTVRRKFLRYFLPQNVARFTRAYGIEIIVDQSSTGGGGGGDDEQMQAMMSESAQAGLGYTREPWYELERVLFYGELLPLKRVRGGSY